MKEDIDPSLFRRVMMFKGDLEGGWNEELVRKVFSMDLAEAIMKLSWPDVECEDKLIWLPNSGKFSVKSSYELIGRNSNVQNNVIWKNLWSLKIHDRLKIFLWRMLAEVIPSKEAMVGIIGRGELMCSTCGVEIESTMHIFKECPVVRALLFASKWGGLAGNWNASSVADLVGMCIKPGQAFEGQLGTEMISVLLRALFYCSWDFRNSVIHNEEAK